MSTQVLQIQQSKTLHRLQLDGLRALAVLQVLFWHFWPAFPANGHRGVQLFFVLSGFLITSILLDCRGLVDSAASSWRFVLKRFYVRRLLRIAPPYYLALLVLALAPSADVRSRFWSHFFYLTNFHLAFIGDWRPWPVAHLWSLATEEQFYLLWPLLILLLPQRMVFRALLSVVALSIVLRWIGYSMGMERLVTIWVVPWASFDALGLGALLALVANSPRRRVLELVAYGATVAILAYAVALRTGLIIYSELFAYVVVELAWSLAFAGLVSHAATGFKGAIGDVLASRVLVYLGRISYGIYLYHVPVLFFLYMLASKNGVAIPAKGPLTFVIASVVTLLIAAASFRWFEAPINGLKVRFPYYPNPRAQLHSDAAKGRMVAPE